jgi:endonuclease I
MKKILLLFLALSTAMAAIPDGYYDNASGLSGVALKAALHGIIDGHTVLSYTPGVWNAYQTTDLKANGKIWDMYSVYEYTFETDQNSGSTPGSEGVDYNREHSWPQSFFNKATPMVTDLFHVYPSDTYVNGKRSNYPYGEVSSASYTSTNGSKLGTARSGLGYTGTVFEPIDDYKGDFARTYFYMATRYYTEDGSWLDWAMADGVELKQWAIDMLLQWHENDTVSTKEINRNDAIYALQYNRNPFIDHPEYVSYIWEGQTPNELIAPVANEANNIDSSSFTANWSSVSEATGYKLFVSEDVGFTSYISQYGPKLLTDTSETVTELIPETDYYYKLKACDADSESAFSNMISLTTLEGTDTVITPPDTGDTHTETFANYPETGSSYNNGSFVGQDGSTWTYDQCRGDIVISNETPCLGKGRSPEASITSGTISGGMGILSFQYKQAYSTNVSLDVYVNDSKIATVTSSNETGTIKESGSISVNVNDDVVLKFIQQSSESGQVAIDNVSWTSYTVSTEPVIPETFRVGNAYPNPFNPRCTLPLELREDTQLKISLYDILGNERSVLFNGIMTRGQHMIEIDGSELSTGLYLIKLEYETGSALRKVLLVK